MKKLLLFIILFANLSLAININQAVADLDPNVPNPHLIITKQVRNVTQNGSFTSSIVSAKQNETVEYKIVITNVKTTGKDADATKLSLVDQIPTGLITPKCYASGANYSSSLDSLGIGMTWTTFYSASVGVSSGSISSTVSVSGGPDPLSASAIVNVNGVNDMTPEFSSTSSPTPGKFDFTRILPPSGLLGQAYSFDIPFTYTGSNALYLADAFLFNHPSLTSTLVNNNGKRSIHVAGTLPTSMFDNVYSAQISEICVGPTPPQTYLLPVNTQNTINAFRFSTPLLLPEAIVGTPYSQDINFTYSGTGNLSIGTSTGSYTGNFGRTLFNFGTIYQSGLGLTFTLTNNNGQRAIHISGTPKIPLDITKGTPQNPIEILPGNLSFRISESTSNPDLFNYFNINFTLPVVLTKSNTLPLVPPTIVTEKKVNVVVPSAPTPVVTRATGLKSISEGSGKGCFTYPDGSVIAQGLDNNASAYCVYLAKVSLEQQTKNSTRMDGVLDQYPKWRECAANASELSTVNKKLGYFGDLLWQVPSPGSVNYSVYQKCQDAIGVLQYINKNRSTINPAVWLYEKGFWIGRGVKSVPVWPPTGCVSCIVSPRASLNSSYTPTTSTSTSTSTSNTTTSTQTTGVSDRLSAANVRSSFVENDSSSAERCTAPVYPSLLMESEWVCNKWVQDPNSYYYGMTTDQYLKGINTPGTDLFDKFGGLGKYADPAHPPVIFWNGTAWETKSSHWTPEKGNNW